jgi:anthranilate phosphoribosyltransferase
MLTPLDFGLPVSSPQALLGGKPSENAEIIHSIFDGKKGSPRDIVVVNAAAGIKVGGKAKSLTDGIKLAEESIDSGSAKNVLQSLVAVK